MLKFNKKGADKILNPSKILVACEMCEGRCEVVWDGRHHPTCPIDGYFMTPIDDNNSKFSVFIAKNSKFSVFIAKNHVPPWPMTSREFCNVYRKLNMYSEKDIRKLSLSALGYKTDEPPTAGQIFYQAYNVFNVDNFLNDFGNQAFNNA